MWSTPQLKRLKHQILFRWIEPRMAEGGQKDISFRGKDSQDTQ